jgi:hypothetical protein
MNKKSRSKTITNFQIGCEENSKDLAHAQSHTKETEWLSGCNSLINSKKDSKERKGN